MVSSSVPSAPKLSPLSYADHVKKAQNSISPQPSRTMTHSVPSTVHASASSSNSIASQSKPLSSNLAVDVKSDPSFDVSTSTDPSSSSLAIEANVRNVNVDTRVNNDLASKALSIVAAHTSSQKSPVANVWNIRKEQLAAARAALTKALAKEIPLEWRSEHGSSASESISSQNAVSSVMNLGSSSASAPNTSHATVNGVTSMKREEECNPFIVRTNVKITRSSKPLPPSAHDADTWPEVGKTAASNRRAANSVAIHLDDSTRNEAGTYQISASVSRKNEKANRMPTTSKEPQTTTDVLSKSSKHQNRKGSHYMYHQQIGSSSYTETADGSAGSASGSAQSYSRGHSASQSNSHSRVPSRSGSLQSSPRLARERHLLADDVSGVSGEGVMNHRPTNWSARPSSPPLVVRPHLQPPRSSIDLSISASNSTYPAQHYHQVGVQTLSDSASSVYRQHYTQSYYHHSPAHMPMHPRRGGRPRQTETPPIQPAQYPNPVAPYPSYAPYAAYDYYNSVSHTSYRDTNQGHPEGTRNPTYPPPQQQPHQHPPLRSGMIHRPLFPAPSQAATRYKEVAVGKEYPVVFGSIGIPGASQSPSPAPLLSRRPNRTDGAHERGEDRGEDEKAFTVFSIGVFPSDGPSRMSSKAPGRRGTVSTSESEVRKEGDSTPDSTESKVIDLTDSQELKWEFGTTSSVRGEGSVRSPSIASENLQVDAETSYGSSQEHVPPVLLTSMAGFGAMGYRSTSRSPHGEVFRGPLQAESISPLVKGALSARSRDAASGDDFEVKDFGYGFGPASGTGRALAITRDEREREKDSERDEERGRERVERELHRDYAEVKDHVYERGQEKDTFRDIDFPMHPGRGSYNGGAGYDRGERGVRRGRGLNGLGRGYHNRRGSFQQHVPQQQQQQPQPHQRQPFALTPSQTAYQPLQTVGDPPNGSYPQHRPSYVPPTTTRTASVPPPLPVPVTNISFPLDPTRWYLLGQLEYYLSPQNMAQDFFLRQQMDVRGWIPVSLIASFNRVRQLTMDEHLVRDVLSLSSIVQVKDDWVRMNSWERYVLPDAATSDMDKLDYEFPGVCVQPFQEEKGGHMHAYSEFYVHGDSHVYDEHSVHSEVHNGLPTVEVEGDAEGKEEEEDEEDEEEEDEEDVVFVMSHDDEGQPWPPERFASS